ncbi:hypothetical protein [Candidatus Thiodictyon syntrophicum]|jgi:hypothetical protein|nr:hypothetical protein [Candidatus Thiodictyon syntrophicum]
MITDVAVDILFVSKPVAFEEFARTVADLGLYWMLINRVPPGVGPAS